MTSLFWNDLKKGRFVNPPTLSNEWKRVEVNPNIINSCKSNFDELRELFFRYYFPWNFLRHFTYLSVLEHQVDPVIQLGLLLHLFHPFLIKTIKCCDKNIDAVQKGFISN